MSRERDLETKWVSFFSFAVRSRQTLILTVSTVDCLWTFRDGVPVNEVLENIELEKIRAVCNQQSRSRWTQIASRDRMYQFIAMSDENTQREMHQKLLMTSGTEGGGIKHDCHEFSHWPA